MAHESIKNCPFCNGAAALHEADSWESEPCNAAVSAWNMRA